MKKLLIASTALVAAGIIAAPAMAADPIKLGLGGKMTQWAGYTTSDLGGNANFDTKHDSEVYFSGSTKLDNGLTVALKMELEADRHNNAASIDHSYMTISSATMGTVMMGSGFMNFNYYAPDNSYGATYADFVDWTGTATGIVLSGQGTNSASLMIPGGAEDSSGISYTTPSFGGFTVRGVYRPETADSNTTPLETASNTALASVRYSGKMGGTDIGVYTAYSKSNNNGTANDSKEIVFGAKVSAAGFTVGGDYVKQSAETKASNDGRAYTVGVGYATGPYNIALTRYNLKTEGTVATAGDDQITNHVLSLAYNMGGGISAKVFGMSYDFDDETTTVANNNSGTVFGVGISAAF